MNSRTKSVLAGLSLLAALPVFAQAGDACASKISEDNLPVPTKIVQPGVSASQFGKVVLLQFTITEEGKAKNIQTVDLRPNDPVLAERIIRALRSWEFTPALSDDGQPVAVSVTMPIKVDHLANT